MKYDVKKFVSGDVTKYVFTNSTAVLEAVLYKYENYEKRTVICCSTQSGCPVGCVFCFPKDTLIQMEDFSYKKIQDIVKGDLVIANELDENSDLENSYSSSYSKSSRVLNTFKRKYKGKVYSIHTKNGETVSATKGHKIAISNSEIDKKFIPIEDIKIGDSILSTSDVKKSNSLRDGEKLKDITKLDKVISISEKEFDDYVYNLETAENTYIANNVLVHNCGTGNKFFKNLKSDEIENQIHTIINDIKVNTENIEKFQIMFMSMGEPLLNFDAVEQAIRNLNAEYPNADLLLSSIAPNISSETYQKLIKVSQDIDRVGIQFSIHESTDIERNKLIPYKNKMTLEEIRDLGISWWNKTGRKPYLNYCITDKNNLENNKKDLQKLFSPVIFCFTFSVVCSNDETMKEKGFKDLNVIRDFEKSFLEKGYNTRIFNPEAQDDIGGGCGQLWYVQKWYKENKCKMKK